MRKKTEDKRKYHLETCIETLFSKNNNDNCEGEAQNIENKLDTDKNGEEIESEDTEEL